MFKMKYSISTVVLAGLLVVGVAACKKNYDQPAPSGDPGVVATISINFTILIQLEENCLSK